MADTKIIPGIVVVLVVTLSIGYAQGIRTGAAEQTLCPVMEGNPIDPNLFVIYKGEKVYFCCDFCKNAFQRDPSPYLAKLPHLPVVKSATVDAANAHDDTSHEEHDIQHDEEQRQENSHDHAKGHDTKASDLTRLLRFTGKFHPVAVHFPIALVLMAALAEIVMWVRSKQMLREFARYCLWAGAFGALAAMGLGLIAEHFASYAGPLIQVLEWHERLGIATTAIVMVTLFLGECAYRSDNFNWRRAYRIGLLLTVLLIGLTGHYGGMLVYGVDHFKY